MEAKDANFAECSMQDLGCRCILTLRNRPMTGTAPGGFGIDGYLT